MPEPSSLVQCVPNFSEGRDPRVLAALQDAVTSVAEVMLLDIHADPWHHRSVFTVAGAPAAVAEAAFRATRTAVERIDLTEHRGEHPRIGAADVVPFAPLRGLRLRECAALARRVGARIAAELDVPVYLYGSAARHPDRARLHAIRRRGVAELAGRIAQDRDAQPDFGPARLHPTAGATAVGARQLLVAFNVALDTDDVGLARRIARGVRSSSGGLPAVQAQGFLVDDRAQVSMNLINVDVTPPGAAFWAVLKRAEAAGVAVHHSEIVGLIPERAADGWERWRLREPIAAKLLEPRIREALDA